MWTNGISCILFQGVAEDKRADAHKYLSDGSGMTQEFNADGDNWTIMSSTSKGGMEFKFTIGQETNSITLDGRPIKVSIANIIRFYAANKINNSFILA